jgi:hypothetical protein
MKDSACTAQLARRRGNWPRARFRFARICAFPALLCCSNQTRSSPTSRRRSYAPWPRCATRPSSSRHPPKQIKAARTTSCLKIITSVQFSSHFGHNPIYLLFDPSGSANAASWLLRLALLFPRSRLQYQNTPLFFVEAVFAPLRHAPADTYLHHLPCAIISDAEASTYPLHSFRIGFACALLVAGALCGTIQALAWWNSAEKPSFTHG